MKLSKQTVEILQNFSTINQSILFLEGNVQKTIHPLKLGYAQATIEESFPSEFAIFDLNKFLGVMSLFEEPELELGATTVTFREGNRTATYRYTKPNMIVHPPKDKRIDAGPAKVSFELSKEDMKTVLKSVALYGDEHVAFEANGESLFIRTLNVKELDSDGVSFRVGDSEDRFRYVVRVEYLTMLPHGYDITISENKKITLRSKVTDLFYIVPTEAKFTTEG